MNLKYNYWYFKEAISPEICDRIVSIGNSRTLNYGEINRESSKGIEEYSEEDYDHLFKTRNSHIAWLDIPWIYNILKPYIQRANEMAGWNFQWDYTEQLQFTTYREGQFYDWHPDQHHYTYSSDDENIQMRGKYRKLSSTLLLNDPQDYEGGELEFHFSRNKSCIAKELDKKGSLVVFPSFVYHRVRPVTSGTRHSLVSWNIGEPFR